MVRFVNCFEVPVGREDEFFDWWKAVNAYMVRKPGYVRHTLHRSLSPEAAYRFVNLADWESPEAWRAAHDEGFRSLVAGSDFRSVPALYEVVHAGATAVGQHAGGPGPTRGPGPAEEGMSPVSR